MEQQTEPLALFLNKKSYHKIKLHLLSSNHFKVLTKVNKIKGVFILDTGASMTFVDLNKADIFKLKTTQSEIKARGSGPEPIPVHISKHNQLNVGKWMRNNFQLNLIDLKPINAALKEQGLKEVDGILGADVLKTGNAIIDYEKKYLYLK